MKRDTILTIKLPRGGSLEDYAVREPKQFQKPARPFTRIAYAAAHVVADPFSAKEPWLEAAIDWDATIAYRRHLHSWGFGIAEAMDTAQRGMGLDWANSLDLIRRTLESVPEAVVASGAGTDHLPGSASIAEVISAYEMQCAAIEKLKWVASRAGINNYNNSMIHELDTNIALGTYYMSYTKDLMNGQEVMATAAYNAGPNRAKKWMAATPLEGAIYAESIPFSETRLYVQKVMANAHIYAHQLGLKSVSLKQRLGVIPGSMAIANAELLNNGSITAEPLSIEPTLESTIESKSSALPISASGSVE